MQVSRAPRRPHNEELHMNGSTTARAGKWAAEGASDEPGRARTPPRSKPHLAFSLSGSSSRHQPTCNAITFPIFHRYLSPFNILDKEDRLRGERSPTPSNSPPTLLSMAFSSFDRCHLDSRIRYHDQNPKVILILVPIKRASLPIIQKQAA